MRLIKIENGTIVSNEIRIDAILEQDSDVDLYLASDASYGHALLHLMPAENHAFEALEKAVKFQSDVLHNSVRCGKYEDALYFSEPFPLGEFMFEWLEKRERVSIAEAIKRVIKLLHVLQKAHSVEIFHGKITPKTILMQRTGDVFELRLMGLGVSEALPPDERLNIDWFDYTFDLEGMTPQAVDIYGMAIILMGLVNGEQGIDSFEATGLLPPVFRGGMIQQAMERALALRIDTYPDVLTFRQDLEAALLEIDAKEGEVYVGDLVGFESAIKSIASISEEHHALHENSGVWSSLVNTLQQEERSSLLYSLTSLTNLKTMECDEDEEDDDVTRISSVPQAVLGLRRIRSSHSSGGLPVIEEKTTITENHTNEPQNSSNKPSEIQTSSDKLAEIQNLESQMQSDSDDDSPTRILPRPNYVSIRVSSEEQSPDTLAKVMEEVEVSPLVAMQRRIQASSVAESSMPIKPDIQYDEPEEACAEPQEAETPQEKEKPQTESNSDKAIREAKDVARELQRANESLRQKNAKLKKTMACVLFGVVVLLLILIVLKSSRGG